MKVNRKITAMLLVIMLMISSMISPVNALAYPSAEDDDVLKVPFVDSISKEGVDHEIVVGKDDLVLANGSNEISFSDVGYKDDDVVTVIVELESKPMIEYSIMSGDDIAKFSVSSEGKRIESNILDEHEKVRNKIKSISKLSDNSILAFGENQYTEGYDYTVVLNGFSMQMYYGDIEKAMEIPEVKSIFVAATFQIPETDFDDIEMSMIDSIDTVGASETWDIGYDGTGTIVSILDTGLYTGHEAFNKMPDDLKYSKDEILELVSTKQLTSGIKEGTLTYVNDKVPYAYDYAARDTNVSGGHNHGTHVGGTIAGDNGNDFKGVAPNAQLLIMKVFDDGGGGATDDIILAGLDDSVKLGADSINMSLGSSAGFSDRRNDVIDEVYGRCYDAGINLLVAAGNDYHSAAGNRYGGQPFAESPDSAMVSTPSTSFTSMSVASVQNTKMNSVYFMLNETVTGSAITGSAIEIPYKNTVHAPTGNYFNAANVLCGAEDEYTNEYVLVGGSGYGYPEDYTGIDVNGKIALVKRGSLGDGTELPFATKATNAKAAGAVAIIAYNNAPGSLIPAVNEAWAIPIIGISQASAQKLIDSENKKITFIKNAGSKKFDSDDANLPSDFSSWGPAPDLAMKPEIAAPGGNIYSAVSGGYAVMSGTSMATPHMAGMAALVRQYLMNDKDIDDNKELQLLTNALLMSTATPSADSENNEFSPRKQGAGIANVYKAVNTKAYITVPDKDKPKIEMGDSEEGTYELNFRVNNLSDEPLRYSIRFVSLMEGTFEKYDIKFVDQKSKHLAEGSDYNIQIPNTISIDANSSFDVAINLELTEALKTRIDNNFENGNYVEGYIYLTPIDDSGEPIDNGIQLTVPYLGFYGDWTKAPAYENFGVPMQGPEGKYLLTPSYFILYRPSTQVAYYLGQNADGTFNYDRLAFSPITGAGDKFGVILTNRRNLENVSVSISDSVGPNASGEKIWEINTKGLRKAFYSGDQLAAPNILENAWNGRRSDGSYPDFGKSYNFKFYGEAGQAGPRGAQEKNFEFYCDGEKPKIDDVKIAPNDDGKLMLSFLVQDDHFINYVTISDANNRVTFKIAIDGFKSEEIKEGDTTRIYFDLTGIALKLAEQGLNPGRLRLDAYDYARNNGSLFVDIGAQNIIIEDIAVKVGESKKINITILPERMKDIALEWSSSDESIATVDENGVVTGIKDGKATITVITEIGLSNTCIATVGKGVSGETDNSYGETPHLNKTLEFEGLTYKIIGPESMHLIQDPKSIEESYMSIRYPSIEGEITIPEIITYEGIDFKVVGIGNRAFQNNDKITVVNLPNTIKVIGNDAFSRCSNLETSLPDSIELIDDNAFYQCTKLNTSIPSNIQRIGLSAFQLSGLTSVNLPEGLKGVGNSAFGGCSNLERANIPLSLTDIGNMLYGNCPKLSNVKIAKGIEKIPVSCFHYCTALKSIDIPEGVIEIGKGAFYGTGLTSIELPESCKIIGEFAYAGLDNCPDIIIPDTVERVEARAFWWCWDVESVVFGSGVKYVGNGVLTGAIMRDRDKDIEPVVRSDSAGIALRRGGFVGKIYKEDGSLFTFYSGSEFAVDGIAYLPISENEVMVIGFDENIVHDIVTIPAQVVNEGDALAYTVTAIDDKVFHKQYNINEVYLPDTITRMGNRTFDQIRALRYINIPANLTSVDNSLSYLGWDTTVNGTWDVDTLLIPSGIKEWGLSAFAGNRYKYLILSEGLESIGGQYAFAENKLLETISLPSTLKKIDVYAFSNCENVNEIELPENLEFIGNGAFQGVSLDRLDISDSVTYIGNYAFNLDYYAPVVDSDGNIVARTNIVVGPKTVNIGSDLKSTGWDAFRKDAEIKVVLNSQRNMLVGFNNFNTDNIPLVSWDGKTDIPVNDGSTIHNGETFTINKNIIVRGKLTVNGTLIIPEGYYVILEDGIIDDENGTIQGKERIVNKIPDPVDPVDPVDPGPVDPTPIDPTPVNPGTPSIPTPVNPSNPETNAEEYLSKYMDLKSGTWYSKSVAFMLEKGYMNGVSDKEFSPNGTLTRAQLVTILHRISGLPSGGYQTSFGDVSSGQWYTSAVEWAVANGIIQGYEDNSFRPNQAVTREQIALILYRSSGKPYSDSSLSAFSDADKISAFALDAMRWAVEQGLIQGSNGRLNPLSSATRAEIATILTRYIDK